MVDFSQYLAAHHVAIHVLDGPRTGAIYPIRAVRLTLGRASADLVFAEDEMSRTHAAIEFRDGQFFLKDLDSANGVLLNGKSVLESLLVDGDRFQIGSISFAFEIEVRNPEPVTHVRPAAKSPS